jgi:methionine-rich copper-binding protein CopC
VQAFYVAVTPRPEAAAMTSVCRALVVLLLAALACVGTTSPASAHVELVWSFPAAGVSLPNPPAEVALEASDQLNLEVSQIIVRDALGEVQPLDGPRLARNRTVLVAGLDDGGAWGQWQVDYRLVGEDGHAVTGQIDFAVGEPAITPGQDGSNLGLWLLLSGGGALLAAAWYLRWSTARAVPQPVRDPVRTA